MADIQNPHNPCKEACIRHFVATKSLFAPGVCLDCNGCVMSQVYEETSGDHPSTAHLTAMTDHAMVIANAGDCDQEPN